MSEKVNRVLFVVYSVLSFFVLYNWLKNEIHLILIILISLSLGAIMLIAIDEIILYIKDKKRKKKKRWRGVIPLRFYISVF